MEGIDRDRKIIRLRELKILKKVLKRVGEKKNKWRMGN